MNALLIREFDQDLSCAQCISAGFVYHYADGLQKDVTTAATGYCCREKADGTLYCGNDEKLFAHYKAANPTNITQARIDNVQELYDMVIAKAATKSKGQALYVSLYTTMASNSDLTKAADKTNLEKQFDQVEFDLKVFANVNQVQDGESFNLYYTRGKAAFDKDGFPASGEVAGDAIKAVKDFMAKTIDKMTVTDFTAVRKTVMLQAIVGKAIEAKFTTAETALKADAANGGAKWYTQNVETSINKAFIATPNNSSTAYGKSDEIIVAITACFLASKNIASSAALTAFDTAYKTRATLVALATGSQKTYSLTTYFDTKLYNFMVAGTGTITGVTQWVPYLASAAVYEDVKALDTFQTKAAAYDSGLKTSIAAIETAIVGLNDATVELGGILTIYHMAVQDAALSSAVTAKVKALSDEYLVFVKQLSDDDGTAVIKTSVAKANRLLIEMAARATYTNSGHLGNKCDETVKVMVTARKFGGDLLKPDLRPIEASLIFGGLTQYSIDNISTNAPLIEKAVSVYYGGVLGDNFTTAKTDKQAVMKELFPTTTAEWQAKDFPLFTEKMGKKMNDATNTQSMVELARNAKDDIANYTKLVDYVTNNKANALKLTNLNKIAALMKTLHAGMTLYVGDTSAANFVTTITNAEIIKAIPGSTANIGSPGFIVTEAQWGAADLTGSSVIVALKARIDAIEAGTAATKSSYSYIFTPTAAAAGAGVIVGGKVLTPVKPASGSYLSNEFKSTANALAACPNRSDICGKGLVSLTTTKQTISPGIYDPKHSCHYLLKATCGYPLVTIANDADSIASMFHLQYLEYQEGVVSAANLPTDWLLASYDVPFYRNANTMMDGGILSIKTGTTTTYTVADKMINDIADYDAQYKAYATALTTYNSEKTAWDAAVTKVEAELTKWKDGTLIPGLKRGPRGNRETALTKLPKMPVAPVAPAAYAGLQYGKGGVGFWSGFGAPTSGMLSPDTKNFGTFKAFGTTAQQKTSPFYGSAIPDVGTTCKKKYIALNVWPSRFYSQGSYSKSKVPKQWKFEVVATASPALPLVTVPTASATITAPVAAKASPFVMKDAAMNLVAATSTLAALVAFSLY